ncbi:MAG: hypothetical protein K9J25_02900 [Bacteroidales bacterium]|nr:hypothetical protein [Bacteroidales bacterium]
MLKFVFVFIVSLFLHPVHVSMSGMEYIQEESGYRVTVRMYSDDLLLDLMSLYELPSVHIKDHVYTGPDEIYGDYVNSRLKIMINGKQKAAKLRSVEKLEIETVIRLFIEHTGKVSSLDISNTILNDIYMDQVNLFIYKDKNNELAYRFAGDYVSEKIK